jgi:type IV secretory pathway VirB10-like protein
MRQACIKAKAFKAAKAERKRIRRILIFWRIGLFAIKRPPALIAPPTSSLETPAAREAKPTPGLVAKKSEAPPPPQPPPPSEEQIRADAEAALTEARLRLEAEAAARREQNRAIAKQSGLLKALSADDGGGKGVGEPAALDRVLSDVSVLSNPSLAPTGAGGAGDDLGTGSGSGFGSGSGSGRLSVDSVVSGLRVRVPAKRSSLRAKPPPASTARWW